MARVGTTTRPSTGTCSISRVTPRFSGWYRISIGCIATNPRCTAAIITTRGSAGSTAATTRTALFRCSGRQATRRTISSASSISRPRPGGATPSVHRHRPLPRSAQHRQSAGRRKRRRDPWPAAYSVRQRPRLRPVPSTHRAAAGAVPRARRHPARRLARVNELRDPRMAGTPLRTSSPSFGMAGAHVSRPPAPFCVDEPLGIRPVPRACRKAPASAQPIVGVATPLGGFSTLQPTSSSSGPRRPGRSRSLAVLNFGFWYGWALRSPIVVTVARRFPLERDTGSARLAVHFGAVL